MSTVLVLELDSIRQSALLARSSSEHEFTVAMVDYIRAALLLSDHITLIDSMILDGAFFLRTSPTALAQALGVHPAELPLEIRTPGGIPLQEALDAKRSSFVWQTSEFTLAQRTERLRAWLEPDLLPSAPLGEFRVEALHSPARVSPPRAAWRAGLSDGGRQLLGELESTTARSIAVRHLETASARVPPAEIQAIAAWWHDAYLMATASANDADWLRFERPEGGERRPRTDQARGRRRLFVDPKLLATARGVNASAYGVLRHATADVRSALHRAPGPSRMRDLTYAIDSFFSAPRRRSLLASAGWRMILAALALFAAFPYLAEVTQSWGVPLDPVWFAFSVAVLTTVPWDTFATLRRGLNHRASPTLSIREAVAA